MRAAHRLAMASKHITADMVEISEYPHLAVKYGVHGVPHTVVNETTSLVGARDEAALVDAVLAAIGK